MEMNGDLPEDNFNEDEEDFEGDTVPDIRGLKVAQPKKHQQVIQRKGPGGNRQKQSALNNEFENH